MCLFLVMVYSLKRILLPQKQVGEKYFLKFEKSNSQTKFTLCRRHENVLEEMNYLFLSSSPETSSTSLTLHYDAFGPPHIGFKSLSPHMFKPFQSIFTYICRNKGGQATFRISVKSWYLILKLGQVKIDTAGLLRGSSL